MHHHRVYACACMMGITPTHSWCVTHMGYPPIHIGTYMYVCPLCTHSAGTHHHTVYPHVHTPVYIPQCICRYLYYLPMRVGLCAGALRGGAHVMGRCGFCVRLSRVASPLTPRCPASSSSRCVVARECLCVPLRGPPMPLRGVLSRSEGLRASQRLSAHWSPLRPSEWLRRLLRASAPPLPPPARRPEPCSSP